MFLAAVPPAAALDDLAGFAAGVRDHPGRPRWTARPLWHLTLTFLGSVAERRRAELIAGLPAAVAGVPAFPLRLAGAGRFPERGPATVLWTGVAGAEPLVGLAGALAAAARSVGVPIERRPYHPHLTLGRWRPADRTAGPDVAALVAALDAYRGPEFTVDEVVLFDSRPGPTPRYDRVAAWPLG